ncbi:MAG: ATP-binding protein [Nitrososphaeria archaeon]
MNIQEIKRVIISQNEEMEEKFQIRRIIGREPGVENLKKFLAQPNILVIMGIRRCGKSVFCRQVLKGERFGYVNFDDERLYGITSRELGLILQAFIELYGNVDYVVLDEPQNVEGWELFANRLRRTMKVIITGSNSRLLSGELATHLTGRHIDFTLMPFSFREYLIYSGTSASENDLFSEIRVAEIKRRLEEYMKKGGMPESYVFGNEMLARIYGDIIEKDVLARTGVRMKGTFRELTRYLISNTASEFTFRKLSNVFGVKDVHTLRNWVTALESSYLIFVIDRYSPKLKQQVIAPKKIYCIDTGLANVMSFKTEERYGKTMENLVAVELLRKKSYWYSSLEIFYWKDHRQNEVDFVIKDGAQVKQLLQVTYASERTEIDNREIRALLRAGSELKCNNMALITWDYEDELIEDGRKISCIPLWKWLLSKRLMIYE